MKAEMTSNEFVVCPRQKYSQHSCHYAVSNATSARLFRQKEKERIEQLARPGDLRGAEVSYSAAVRSAPAQLAC
jgi:hypothetical protein